MTTQETKPYYRKMDPASDRYVGLWWCEIHRRRAMHFLVREGQEDEPHCDPMLGGIAFPCICRIKIKQ